MVVRMRKLLKYIIIIVGILFVLYTCSGIKVWGGKGDEWCTMDVDEVAGIGVFLNKNGFLVAAKEGRVNRKTGDIEVKVFEIVSGHTCIYEIKTKAPTEKGQKTEVKIDRRVLGKDGWI